MIWPHSFENSHSDAQASAGMVLGNQPQARARDTVEKLHGYNYIHDTYLSTLTLKQSKVNWADLLFRISFDLKAYSPGPDPGNLSALRSSAFSNHQ